MFFIGSVGLLLVLLGVVLLIQGEAATLLAILAFIIGIVLLGFLSIKFADIISAAAAKIKYRNWAKMPAEITKIEPSKKVGTRGYNYITLLVRPNVFDITYKYVYDGKEYLGESMTDIAPEGNNIQVYVNPRDPQQSYF
ncbi:MAG: DUF3592 domain-containing protein [Elusimicrobiota bacterium]|jgi:hypothetical protein|nr:DUF3592 domain-containing protein [Elusimicrobiota bacterium]